MKYVLLPILLLFSNLNLAQISNPGFEEWEQWYHLLKPSEWNVEGLCPHDSLVIKSKESIEGNWALQIRGVCTLGEVGFRPGRVSQKYTMQDSSQKPTSIQFWYKLVNIKAEESGVKEGCGWVVVDTYNASNHLSKDSWFVKSSTDISEWVKVNLLIELADSIEKVTHVEIELSGGGCSFEHGYHGNADFIIDGFQTITTGVDNFSEESGIKIYPNPVKEFIQVQNAENSTVEIYDCVGTLLMTKKIGIERRHRLELSNLNKGMYLVKVLETATSQSKAVLKFIKI